jgi:cytochrome c oxidase assembly protein subunit 11
MAGGRRSSVGFTAAVCLVFVAAMVGAAFAAVPFYRVFCQVTGYGGTTQRAEKAPGETLDRVVTVRFDANIGNGLGWNFRPLQREVQVKLGAVGEAVFRAENRTQRTMTGRATFNVTPGDAGAYFNKIACFCFSDQTLAAGETADMPVTFFVDPAMVKDANLRDTDTITLSYTFYPAENPPQPVAAADAVRTGG